MKHFSNNSLVFIAFIANLWCISIPFNIDFGWESIQKNNILIETINYGDYQFCKAKTELKFSKDEIIQILEDKLNYPTIFKRITLCKELGNGLVYMQLDMPFPFSSRDFIIQYTKEELDNILYYEFNTPKNHLVPLEDGFIRLINYAGGWIIKPLNDNETEVTYIWNGELLGDFPKWALSRAWKEQGNEVLNWLEEALSK